MSIRLKLNMSFFFSSRRRHTRFKCDWSSDVCSSDTLFGGFAPMILTWAKQQSAGSIYAPAWYVMCAAGLALLAIPWLGRAGAGRRGSVRDEATPGAADGLGSVALAEPSGPTLFHLP